MTKARTNETDEGRTKKDKAVLARLKCCSEPFSSAAIKAELQSNESRRWGLCSLCCVLCPLLMASRCGGISQVWLWKTFPHINPIRSDPAHELDSEQASALTTAQTLHRQG